MNTPLSPLRRLHGLEIAAGAYLFFALGRSFYEIANLCGLYGWLADGQLRFLGHFGFKTTLAVTFGIYLLPFLAAVRYSVQARERLTRAGIIARKPADPARTTATAGKVFAGLGAGVALAGAVVYFFLQQQARTDARRPVERFTLEAFTRLPAAAVAGLKFVEITATCQTRAGWGWVKSNRTDDGTEPTHYRYLPLTPPGWRTGDPVRCFLATTEDAYLPPDAGGRPADSLSYGGTPFGGAFEGELERDALPVFAAHAMQRRGVRIAEPFYVVQSRPLHGHGPRADAEPLWMIPILGGIVGLGLAGLGGWLYLQGGKLAARAAATRR